MKLNEVLAVDKRLKEAYHNVSTEAYKAFQKPGLFLGEVRDYTPKDEAGERLPPERAPVQQTVERILAGVQKALVVHVDATYAKDEANTRAHADVTVGGWHVAHVPATTLLYLEKKLTDLAAFFRAAPVLSVDDSWERDEAAGLWKTQPQDTVRTKKEQRPIVLYPATDKHPAQTQLITDDVIVGRWSRVRHSGAIPEAERAGYIERTEALLAAVKQARERANASTAVAEVTLGASVASFILGS